MGGLEGRAKGEAENEAGAQELRQRQVISDPLVGSLHSLPDASLAKLRPLLSTQVCLCLHDINALPLRPPQPCARCDRPLPSNCVSLTSHLHASRTR